MFTSIQTSHSSSSLPQHLRQHKEEEEDDDGDEEKEKDVAQHQEKSTSKLSKQRSSSYLSLQSLRSMSSSVHDSPSEIRPPTATGETLAATAVRTSQDIISIKSACSVSVSSNGKKRINAKKDKKTMSSLITKLKSWKGPSSQNGNAARHQQQQQQQERTDDMLQMPIETSNAMCNKGNSIGKKYVDNSDNRNKTRKMDKRKKEENDSKQDQNILFPSQNANNDATSSSSAATATPLSIPPPPPVSPLMPLSLPPGWKTVIDTHNTGFAYYVNTVTQQSQWHLPTVPASDDIDHASVHSAASDSSLHSFTVAPAEFTSDFPSSRLLTHHEQSSSSNNNKSNHDHFTPASPAASHSCSKSKNSTTVYSCRSSFTEQARLLDSLFTNKSANASNTTATNDVCNANLQQQQQPEEEEQQSQQRSLSHSVDFSERRRSMIFSTGSSFCSQSSRPTFRQSSMLSSDDDNDDDFIIDSANKIIKDYNATATNNTSKRQQPQQQEQRPQQQIDPEKRKTTFIGLDTAEEEQSFPLKRDVDVYDDQCSVSLISHIDYLAIGFIESSPDPMFQIDEDGTIHMVNQAATHQFQYNRDEFLGANISIIVGMCHNPEKHTDYIKRYIRTGEKRVMGIKRELMARRKDGTEFPIELGLSEVTSRGVNEESTTRRFCGFIRDVTSQYKNQLELKRRERISKGLIESSLDPMFNITSLGIICMVNQAALEQFGWTREEFIGQNISMIVGREYKPEKHDEYIQRYLKTGKKRVMGKKRELKARRKDGSEFPIELSLSEVTIESDDNDVLKSNGSCSIRQKGGKNKGVEEKLFCGVVRDLTQQKEYIEDLARKERYTSGIIEASFDSMIAFDGRGIIRRCNHASCHQFGYSTDEFLSGDMNVKTILAEAYREQYASEIKLYLQTGGSSGGEYIGKQREVFAVRKDGTTFPILLGIMEVERDSNSIAASSSFRENDKEDDLIIDTADNYDKSAQTLFVAFVHDLTDQKKLMQVEIEKTAAEVLLLNILPAEIALRLKDNPSNNIADHHKMATILFADIVGFTALSSRLEPFEVVKMLNELFSLFDDLVDKYDINKVKTIGDCYMVTSVPVVEHEADECVRVCHFAFDMLEMVQLYNATHPDSENLQIRVGINSGPVVAGVVGTKRVFYDLWGDAVNIASRMESTGVAGRIQVTKEVVDLLGSSFKYERRGEIHVKGKGHMETFFLRGRGKRRSSFFETSAPRSMRSKETGKVCKNLSWSLMESLKAFEKILREKGMDSKDLGFDFEGVDSEDETEEEVEVDEEVENEVDNFLKTWASDFEVGLKSLAEDKEGGEDSEKE